MKKFIAGVVVLAALGVYSLAARHKETALVQQPTNISTSQSSASTPAGSGPPNNPSPAASYKDGTYTGSVANAYYGNVQVSATISGGKIVDVKFLQYPSDHSTSVMINQQAIPYLKQEAIQAQSANVQIISGATFTSQAFQQSLQAALSQA